MAAVITTTTTAFVCERIRSITMWNAYTLHTTNNRGNKQETGDDSDSVFALIVPTGDDVSFSPSLLFSYLQVMNKQSARFFSRALTPSAVAHTVAISFNYGTQ